MSHDRKTDSGASPMAPAVYGVAQFAQRPGSAGPASAARYAVARVELAKYRAAVKRELDGPGLPVAVRVLALRLSERLYRAFRKAYGDDVFALVAEPVAEAVRRGMKSDLALTVVRASRIAFGRAFSEEDFARIRRLVEENLGGGEVRTEVKSRNAEVRRQNAEAEGTTAKSAKAAKVMPNAEGTTAKNAKAAKVMPNAEGTTAKNAKAAKMGMAASEFDIRHSEIENGGGGNGKRPASGVERNASGVKRRSPGPGISFANVMQATPLERMRKQKAEVSLREALAVHQPIVKECVALRLCKHLGYDELAERLDLTRQDVAEILEKLRPWVGRFTTFFESDWYWLEAVGPDTTV